MAHIEVVETIEAHIRQNFDHCPVFIENETLETPQDGSAFLKLSFPYARSEQSSIGTPGANWWREDGAFVLTLAMPRGAGTALGRRWLEDAAISLRGRRIGEVVCRAPQSPVSDDDNDIAGYYRLIMAVPYRFTLTG